MTFSLIQHPEPGRHKLMFCGDTVTFTLTLSREAEGEAWLRTNLGRGTVVRTEILGAVEKGMPPLGRDWYDLPMRKAGGRRYTLTLPLCEVGHFAGKCYFIPEGARAPLWPGGKNTTINVGPATTCCANIMYNAFVRQFGPNKAGRFFESAPKEPIDALDRSGYTVIPPSGTFRDLIRELDFIVDTLGCRFIQLLPVFPTPTNYGRMGRFGSPYAALSFTALDPALAEFDPKATPLDQFVELVDAVHARGVGILLDIAINHTGWAAGIHETHPEWLSRDEEGKIKMPGAWGITWADLTKLDYSHKDLWRYMADVLITWCRRGVDGFRCDAGYMIPNEAWTYIIAAVRNRFPDTIFFLEGLGGKISVTRDLLNRANFDWAYSELFQNYDRGAIEHYLPEPAAMSAEDGLAVHFAETHDNNRLAATSVAYARMRTALCALLSFNGAFAFANGVEWHADEKIDVHEARSLNWEGEPNQVKEIGRLSALLKHHPAFFPEAVVEMIQTGKGNHLAVLRTHAPTGKKILAMVNLDAENSTDGVWDDSVAGFSSEAAIDLLSGREIAVVYEGHIGRVRLEPGQVFCLCPDDDAVEAFYHSEQGHNGAVPERVRKQRLRAIALAALQSVSGIGDLGDTDPDAFADRLFNDPVSFCKSLIPEKNEPIAEIWRWPEDEHRQVMSCPGHFLLIIVPHRFRARIILDGRTVAVQDSLAAADGSRFVLFCPMEPPKEHTEAILSMTLHYNGGSRKLKAPLLLLSRPEDARAICIRSRSELSAHPVSILATNGRGGMLRASSWWGKLESRYDALLAANPDPRVPVDRRIMLSRCRGWIVYQGFSQEIGPDVLDRFGTDGRFRGFWQLAVPTGQGAHVLFSVGMEMMDGKNAMQMVFYRHPAEKDRQDHLADDAPVQLILRPDIEDRSFHEVTKAYTGPESLFPDSVTPVADGFDFAPTSERCLSIRISRGSYVHEPEWAYMVHRPLEAQRGLDPDSDLFSPGYLSVMIEGGQSAVVTAGVNEDRPPDSGNALSIVEAVGDFFSDSEGLVDPALVLTRALDQFIVSREGFKTVIAGYPWFLDWGRDSLIVLRCLVEIGRMEEARAILKQFCRFEDHGTIPNMIRGEDTANRDTADAPLWLVITCGELAKAEGGMAFFDEKAKDRTIREILISIGEAYIQGTANGIRMDPESALIYSPAHFTWMDTNHPAGTPRQGYPVEIQALWFAAVNVLARLEENSEKNRWTALAGQIRSSMLNLFYLKDKKYLADCLHADAGVSAAEATADDALRPNQLLCLTLSAIEEKQVCENVLDACRSLLVPGAIRSLADRPLVLPLTIEHHGRTLSDPHRPYQGTYAGDEDTQRKPAYHNGTAWTWPFPGFCEAWAAVYGKAGLNSARAWLASGTVLLNTGCMGQIPEILDGNAPHAHRGCDAQAWGVSEMLRVWRKLEKAT